MTPEQDKIAARAAELKTYIGKTFVNKVSGAIRTIKDYAGIKTKDGVSAHTFLVEGIEGRWTPPATQFLVEHDEIPTVAESTATSTVI